MYLYCGRLAVIHDKTISVRLNRISSLRFRVQSPVAVVTLLVRRLNFILHQLQLLQNLLPRYGFIHLKWPIVSGWSQSMHSVRALRKAICRYGSWSCYLLWQRYIRHFKSGSLPSGDCSPKFPHPKQKSWNSRCNSASKPGSRATSRCSSPSNTNLP